MRVKNLHLRAVELHHREAIRIDAVQAAHIDHHHRLAGFRIATGGVSLHAAARAEIVIDDVLVKFLGRQRVLAGLQREIVGIRGGQQ